MTLPMTKGYYDAHASSTPISFGQTSRDGETRVQIAVEFEIDDADYAGETITWVGHFTDKTAARTVESLQIAGWAGEDVSELDGVPGSEVLPDAVSLVCEVDEYNGERKLKVQWVNRPGGGRFKFKEACSGADLKTFAAQLRATVKSVRAAGGAPRKEKAAQQQTTTGAYRKPAQHHPNAPGFDPDIPF